MSKTASWPLEQAYLTADSLVEILTPFCERIAVAGSIRRRTAEVGDIELVCISKQRPSWDLFGVRPGGGLPLLDIELERLISEGLFAFRLNSQGNKTFGPENKFLVHVPSGISVDIFSTTTAKWGMTLFIRTGPKEFNVRVMTALRAQGMLGHANGGITDAEGAELPCPDEEEVFRILGQPWISPAARS